MKKLGIIILIVAVLGFLVWYFFLRAPKPISYITVPVEKGSLVVSIPGSGQVVAQNREDITPDISGTVEEIYVQEGDIVEKDQDLFKIKNNELDTATTKAWGSYIGAKESLERTKISKLQAQENLDELRRKYDENDETLEANLAQAEASYSRAKESLDRARISKLQAQESLDELEQEQEDDSESVSNLDIQIAEQQVKNADLAIQSAEDTLRSAELDYNKAKEAKENPERASALGVLIITNTDIQIAEEQVKNADQAIQSAESTVSSAWLDYETAKDKADERIVKSSIKGTVVDSSIKVGDSVGGQTTASLGEEMETKSSSLTIIDLTTLKAQISINEVDLSKIKKEQLATLTLDALPEKEFTGKVVHIDTLGTVSQNIVTYNVDISIDNLEESGIMPDMTVNTSIIIDKKDNVLLVPNSAIKTVKGKTQVQILVDNQPQNIEIETGLTDDVQTEIISGLKEGLDVITGTIGEEVEQGKPSPFKMPGFGSPKGSVGESSHGFSK